MFIGHYGVAFAVKSVEKRIPLWLLFLAVQFVDLLWGVLVLLGVEKARITQEFRGSLPLDLYYMPYTHSLPAVLVWSLAAYLAYRLVASKTDSPSHRVSLLVALAVLSHWILDLVVHRPDMPLYDDAYKLGLALWNYPLPALALEIGIYFGGLWLYLRTTSAVTFMGKHGLALLGLGILAIQVVVFWWPVLPSATIAAAVFLAGYLQLAATATWLEKKRSG
ncbi:MAG TPA: hypothetical protein VNN18_04915 [Candidatus Xenobia bacterium]|nr:hypothetical protein [Candidatus Xenobia bacterium]